ncbi:hypothetical protein [Paracoccus sp. PARArs4]|uniref:hypothetical protein n=1 Tax=Paracoccus sp. PARArs4 TaxID=2853442 RepID=UPI0024A756FD|nr:hypothetical protein [Paracoccus sp. PARArs4]
MRAALFLSTYCSLAGFFRTVRSRLSYFRRFFACPPILVWMPANAGIRPKNCAETPRGLIVIGRGTNALWSQMLKCGGHETRGIYLAAHRDRALSHGLTHVGNLNHASAYQKRGAEGRPDFRGTADGPSGLENSGRLRIPR